MSPRRNFPFGHPPAPRSVEQTQPLPTPNPQRTAPLSDFLPPAYALPFRRPLVPAPPPQQAPAPPLPAPPRARISFRQAAALVLLVLDIVVLAYLALTWRS